MKHKALLLLLFTFLCSITYSQKIIRSSINSFGSVMQSKEISLSQSAGQASNTVNLINKDREVTLRQGFQQPTNTHFKKTNKILNFELYPNPNSGSFSIFMNERIGNEFNYRIIDNQGRIFSDEKIFISGVQELNLSLPSGSYILQLKDTSGKTGTAKIIILQ